MSVRVPRLGIFLEPSWWPHRPSWRPLGLSRGSLEEFRVSLGGLLGCLLASGSRKGENAKMFQKLRGINCFSLFGLFGDTSGSSRGDLEASWTVWRLYLTS
eukprot:5766701-Pyramimonas_sp.AAC.1